MSNKISLTCGKCNKSFEKEAREYSRQIKNGREKNKFFCSRSCAMSQNMLDNPRPGNPEFLVSDNRRDEYTEFRWFVNRGNYRGKRRRQYGCDLTVEYLKELWEKQSGFCPFTGWKLILPKDSSTWDDKNIRNASLDRIDNSIGYMQGNVRFVSVMANLARQAYTDDEVIEFCKAVTENNK